MSMKQLFKTIAVMILLAACCYPRPIWAGQVFPYPVQKTTLPNGLDLVVVETPEFKNVLSYNVLIFAGARNETERGKTGLAHFFEHMLFRHEWQGQKGGYNEAIKKLGVHDNAFTTFDITYYHPLSFTSNMLSTKERSGLVELQADRFKNLVFDLKTFQTEAGAVLGEYRRYALDPELKMSEQLLTLMFGDNSYAHTTMGFYEDIIDYPKKFDAAMAYYHQYYRPNNAVVIVVGDVKMPQILEITTQYFGNWQRGPIPTFPEAKPPQGPKESHLSWDSDVSPRLAIAYAAPRFKTGSKETAVFQILPELLASETAPLYLKLRYEKKLASEIMFSSENYESFGPRLLEMDVILFKEQYMQRRMEYFKEVIRDVNAGLAELKTFGKMPRAAQWLENIKSKYRYDLLGLLDSPSNIAMTMAWYYRFDRDPAVLDQMVNSVSQLTVQDVEEVAKQYLVPEHQVIVTLANEAKAKEETHHEK
jgi:zinc protease